jgi:hypothetical protein
VLSCWLHVLTVGANFEKKGGINTFNVVLSNVVEYEAAVNKSEYVRSNIISVHKMPFY